MENTIKRKSKQREAIIAYLMRTISHPTALEVFDEVRKEFPDISLGTVYRNLNQLVQNGLAIELNVGEGASRYDGRLTPHSHFICARCGAVLDVFDGNCQTPSSLKNFTVINARTEYFGLCEKCK